MVNRIIKQQQQGRNVTKVNGNLICFPHRSTRERSPIKQREIYVCQFICCFVLYMYSSILQYVHLFLLSNLSYSVRTTTLIISIFLPFPLTIFLDFLYIIHACLGYVLASLCLYSLSVSVANFLQLLNKMNFSHFVFLPFFYNFAPWVLSVPRLDSVLNKLSNEVSVIL